MSKFIKLSQNEIKIYLQNSADICNLVFILFVNLSHETTSSAVQEMTHFTVFSKLASQRNFQNPSVLIFDLVTVINIQFNLLKTTIQTHFPKLTLSTTIHNIEWIVYSPTIKLSKIIKNLFKENALLIFNTESFFWRMKELYSLSQRFLFKVLTLSLFLLNSHICSLLKNNLSQLLYTQTIYSESDLGNNDQSWMTMELND